MSASHAKKLTVHLNQKTIITMIGGISHLIKSKLVLKQNRWLDRIQRSQS